MNPKAMISLCDLTGHMAEPWVEAGYRCIIVDPQHSENSGPLTWYTRDNGIECFAGVVDKFKQELDWIWETLDVQFVAAFPPCTDLAVSGARWFASKAEVNPRFQEEAMQVVYDCHAIAEYLGSAYMIENPVSCISSLWRKPDYSFHPWQFTGYCKDDNYTKKTCLWTGNGFIMPEPFIDESLGEPDDRIHKAPPSSERANFRSATPRGFAKAVYEANKQGDL